MAKYLIACSCIPVSKTKADRISNARRVFYMSSNLSTHHWPRPATWSGMTSSIEIGYMLDWVDRSP